jgi:hypothetical protein
MYRWLAYFDLLALADLYPRLPVRFELTLATHGEA